MRLAPVLVVCAAACASRGTAPPAPRPVGQPAPAASAAICRLAAPSRADLVTLAKECPDYARFEQAKLSGISSFDVQQEAADIMLRQARLHPDNARVLYNAAGLKDIVLALRGCQRIWDMDEGRIAKWIADIERGGTPRMDRFAF